MRYLYNFFFLIVLSISSQAYASDLFNSGHVKDAFRPIEMNDLEITRNCDAIGHLQVPEQPLQPGSPEMPQGSTQFEFKELDNLSFDLELDALAYQNLTFLEGMELKGDIAVVQYRGGEVYINDQKLNNSQAITTSNYLKKLCHQQ